MDYQIQNEKIITKEGICLVIFLFFIVLTIELFPRINLNIPNSLFYTIFINYDYFKPPIFLSIGEAMAAVAIILAVWQFKRDTWEIALEVRKNTIPIVFSLCALGLLSIVTSSIIPLTFSQPNNILQLSLFWQLLGGIFILSSLVFLIWKAQDKHLFNKKTKDRFIGSLLRRVLSRSPQQIGLVANTLLSNLNTILGEVKTIPRKGGEISEFTKSAHFVLTQIVSNPTFAHCIVTNRADLFQSFLRGINKDGLYFNHAVSVAFGSLIKASFLSRDSYLYNEYRHSDPGVYYRPFLEDIFFDQNVFLELRPFDQIGFGMGESITAEKLGLFLMSLETALEGYFQKPRSINFEYSHYRQAFEHVENAFSRIVDEAENNKSKNNWGITSKLHQITFFVGWIFRRLYKEAAKNQKVSQDDLDASIEEKSYGIYPKSLTAGYAQLLFNLLCILDRYPQVDTIQHYATSITDHILIFNEPEFSNIRNILLKYIWERINGEHTSNINGYYPTILPVFLSLFGMWQDGATPEYKEQYNKTVEFLNNELKPKILANAKMANDHLMEEVLLPPEIKFNRSKNLFEWQMHSGTQEMITRD
jgi:hypothetical protein